MWDPITSDLYDDAQTRGLPAEAVLASLGCGNPTALAELHEGEVGFVDIGIEPTRVYSAEDAEAFGGCACGSGAALDGAFMSAFVRAVKA